MANYFDPDTQKAADGQGLDDTGPQNDVGSSMARSNAQLASYQARNPVVPNQPVIGGGDTTMYGDPASGVMIPVPAQDNSGGTGQGPGLMDVIGGGIKRGMNAVEDFYGVRPDWQRDPVIAPSLKESRTEPVTTPTSPLTNAANEAPQSPQSSRVPYTTQNYDGGGQQQIIQPDYKAQLAALNARDTQNFNERMDRQVGQADRANAVVDQDRARGEARVANWNSEMARMDLVGNIGGSLSANQVAYEKSLEKANSADQNVKDLGQVIRSKDAPQSNAVDSELKLQEAARAGRAGQIGEAQAQTQLQTAQAAQKQQARLNELGGSLANETDPTKRQRIQDTILTLLGKEKGDRYKVIHAQGGEVLGPDGFTKIRQPDSVVLHDTQSGQIQILPIGGQTAAPTGPKDGEIRTDPQTGKRGRYDAKANKWVAA